MVVKKRRLKLFFYISMPSSRQEKSMLLYYFPVFLLFFYTIKKETLCLLKVFEKVNCKHVALSFLIVSLSFVFAFSVDLQYIASHSS